MARARGFHPYINVHKHNSSFLLLILMRHLFEKKLSIDIFWLHDIIDRTRSRFRPVHTAAASIQGSYLEKIEIDIESKIRNFFFLLCQTDRNGKCSTLSLRHLGLECVRYIFLGLECGRHFYESRMYLTYIILVHRDDWK